MIQFLLFIAFVFDVESLSILFPTFVFWVGIIIFVLGGLITITAVLQLNVHLSPFPSPLPGSRLIKNGVYKFMRHPIYTGLLLSLLGYSIVSDSGYRLIITMMLLVLFYFKTKYEEIKLIEMFPEYHEYKKIAGRFLPRFF